MKTEPAIAIIEFDSIAVGTTAGDAMVKKAPITMFQAGTLHPGKYLVMVGGDTASVEESYAEGLRVGGADVTDRLMLPDVHGEVYEAVLGRRRSGAYEALGIIETCRVPSTVHAADAAIKGAAVFIIEIRLGDGLGGKGIVHFGGAVADVQAAVQTGTEAIEDRGVAMRQTVIPSLHEEVARSVDVSTRFFGQSGER